MKTKHYKKDKINIVTLGCSKNLVDSEVMLTQLKGNNISVEHEGQQNDSGTVIINTCGFIDNAKQESIDTILQYVDAKKKGDIEKVVVTGCLSERYKEDLKNEIPEVDSWYGTNDLKSLLKEFKADYKHELIGERKITTASHYAYLKIAEGCDRPCSFCAIPLMRGKHVSRSIEDLILEAKNLAKNGVKELMLIAQDLTYYGLDLYKKRELANLLKHLSDVEGIDWIRLHYAFPTGFPMDVFDVMNERDNVCNYLDIPLQHASSDVLKVMRRGITKEKTKQLITDIRNKVPDIAIRTTMLVGHPGETREAFDELVEFVEEMKFERLGVFPYSHEENTHAFLMEDSISAEEKEERVNELMDVQSQISFELNRKRINTVQKVLIDRVEGEYYIGRTEYDSPEVDNEVLIKGKDDYLRIGDFVTAKIIDATEYDLFAQIQK